MSICLALVRRTAVIRTSKGTWHANLLEQGAGTAPRARTRQASRPRRGIHRSRSDGRRPEGGVLRAAQSELEGAKAVRRRSRAVGIVVDHGVYVHQVRLGLVAGAESRRTGRG